MTITTEILTLLGTAIWTVQKLEFALYGLAAHSAHLPEAQKDKRFANLTPQDFLSTDPEKKASRNATLGVLTTTFGDRFRLPAHDLEDLVARRNLIAHEFWREVGSKKGTGAVSDPTSFLHQFTEDCKEWLLAVGGLISHLVEQAAINEGRTEEHKITETDLLLRRKWELKILKWFEEQQTDV